LFSVEECILGVHQRPTQALNKCPLHGECEFETLAPDVNFHDLANDFIFESTQIKRGQLLGKGAFGAVFKGLVKSQFVEAYEEVALKVLESISESQFFGQKNFVSTNTSDRLETISRSYFVARQELNLLGDIQHPNITGEFLENKMVNEIVSVLIGFSRAPLTLLMELAPHGALNQLLNKYRRSELRLSSYTIQQTCSQVCLIIHFYVINLF
jgi:serine/threonine protein kinase